jgi:hypothetical protein
VALEYIVARPQASFALVKTLAQAADYQHVPPAAQLCSQVVSADAPGFIQSGGRRYAALVITARIRVMGIMLMGIRVMPISMMLRSIQVNLRGDDEGNAGSEDQMGKVMVYPGHDQRVEILRQPFFEDGHAVFKREAWEIDLERDKRGFQLASTPMRGLANQDPEGITRYQL